MIGLDAPTYTPPPTPLLSRVCGNSSAFKLILVCLSVSFRKTALHQFHP